uniref:Uncharacterized protein n=1 Tax=Steinernema glaseri TaxID=37863 RepID=A0A1I7Y6I4_9BILA
MTSRKLIFSGRDDRRLQDQQLPDHFPETTKEEYPGEGHQDVFVKTSLGLWKFRNGTSISLIISPSFSLEQAQYFNAKLCG